MASTEVYHRTFYDTVFLNTIEVSDQPQAEEPRANVLAFDGGPLARAARAAVVGLVARLHGADKAQVAKALAMVEADSGRPILDWLRDGGLELLIELILKFLPIAI